MSIEELANLPVTTVTRQDSTLRRSPAAIYVITQEDIRRSGATTIPELLRRVPGMNVGRVDANKWAISARGFNDRFANKLLVQIDGRTVYSPIFSGVFWDTADYPLEDIERIEIIRGPGASTWGANAVNGVINILTKAASATRGGFVNGGVGTEERAFGAIRYGGTVGTGFDYRIYGKSFLRDESHGVAPAPFDDWSGFRAGMRSDWRASDTYNLTIQSDYVRSDAARIDFRPQPTSPFVYTNAEHELSNTANVLARWSPAPDAGPGWTVQGYWDHVGRRSTGEILVFNMDTFDLDAQHESALFGRHRVVWGVGYRSVSANVTDSRFDGFILAWDPHHRRLHTANAFAQDQITVVPDRLDVVIGTKLERNSLTGVEIQPSGRLLWTPTRRQTAWAAVSRAVRTPTLFEDQRSVTQTPVAPQPGVTMFPRIVANPDLASEHVVAYELGYRSQTTRTSSIDVAAFYNVYDDLKVFAPAGSSTVGAPDGTSFRLSTHQNLMEGDSYGFELSSRWNPRRPWQLYGAYSLLKMNLRADDNLPAQIRATSEAAERQSPRHQLYLQSSLDLPGHTELDVMGRVVSSLSGFQQPVDDYVAIDLRMGWTPHSRLALDLVGQNMLDRRHLEVGGSVLAGPLHELQRGVLCRISTHW